MTRSLSGRFLVLTGTGLSFIVFALALLVHNHLQNKDLAQGDKLTRNVRQLLSGAPIRPATVGQTPDIDRFERALMLMAAATPVDALPFYDEGERASFARSRWAGEIPSHGGDAALRPPYGVDAIHDGGIVLLRWELAPATAALRDALPQGQSLAWRIYRGLNLEQPVQVAELGLETRRWHDQELPIAHTRLAYQVWAVLIDDDSALIAAEPSGLVTIELEERFQLELVSGDEQSAVFTVQRGSSTQPLTLSTLRVSPGQSLRTDRLDTGLALKHLSMRADELLQTRSRLDFRADGSLVLDPALNTPRKTETQVLVSVRRLIATLNDSLGVPRTLQLDLPR
ncbi:MAG: hypothetical protein ACI9EF_001782 [Pseudohongiellaceae bacterium]|jgi:hypothetical protein